MKNKCPICGIDVPAERLEFYKTCIKCADQSTYQGFMSFDCKTNGSIQIIKNPNKNPELVRQAERANRRAR